jgi:thiamine biosynthesis protein ThiI
VLHLVRYGEIGVKSARVRARFESRLVENIRTMLANDGLDSIVRRDRGRVFVSTSDGPARRQATGSALRRTFGVVSFSPVEECDAGMAGMERLAVSLAAGWPSGSFAIRARRAGSHSFTSRDVAVALGRAIQRAAGAGRREVDLDTPERELHVEVRERRAYLFESIVPGPGGFPVGTAGRVGAALASPQDAAAAWLALKRGCALLVAGPDEHVKMLRRWAPSVKVVATGGEGPWSALLAARAEAIVEGSREPVSPPTRADGSRVLLLQPLIGLTNPEIGAIVKLLREPP